MRVLYVAKINEGELKGDVEGTINTLLLDNRKHEHPFQTADRRAAARP